MDTEEVVMLTRSILASKKHPITFTELQKEYFELNGMRLPFRNIGFDSVFSFLQNFTDKFSIQKNELNEFTVKAKIDAELAALSKLVAGQKSTKKKKSKSKQTRPSFQNQNNFRRPVNRTNSYTYSNRDSSRDKAFPRLMDVRTIDNRKNSSNFSLDDKLKAADVTKSSSQRNVIFSSGSNSLRINFRSSDLKSYGSDEVVKSPYIDNAAYFLKEATIVIGHFQTCQRVFVRLIGENFSVKYEKMLKRLNEDYKQYKNALDLIEVGTFCVAYDEDAKTYYRAQIKKLDQQTAFCFNLDEGKSSFVNFKQLFIMNDEYRELKFQAVKAELFDFDKFANNEYVLKVLRSEYCSKNFLAKRTNNSPLTIAIYDHLNCCLNEKIIQDLENFIVSPLQMDQIFDALISYIDEELGVTYLQFCGEFKDKFEAKMAAVNKYYLFSSQMNTKKEYDIIFKGLNEAQTIICFAKYVDQIWYRAKILKKIQNEEKVLVHFIDFGNKEVIPLGDIRVIETNFAYLKHLPPQAIGVFILNTDTRIEAIKYFMYDAELVNFKVVRLNSSGIASVQLNESLSRSSSQTSSSSNLTDDGQPIKECSYLLSNLTINPRTEKVEKENSNEIVRIFFKDMEKQVLTNQSLVHVINATNPTDFVIYLESSQNQLEQMKKSMKEFYSKNSDGYTVQTPVIDGVYVYRDENDEYHRIKICSLLRCPRIYKIDTGNYDITDLESIFHITRNFIKLKPLAFKASLSNLTFDYGEIWSQHSKEFFKSQVIDKPLFQIEIQDRNTETNTYKIDLIDRNGSIGFRLVEKGFAKLK